MQQGAEIVIKTEAVVVVVVVSLVAACARTVPTPTPTPEPTPTPVWVLATKPEHLAGLWFNGAGGPAGQTGLYQRFEADGTIRYGLSLKQLEEFGDRGRFWFEDGVYYEETDMCFPIGSYWAYLEVEGARAVGLRFEEIEDSDPSCSARRSTYRSDFLRVE
jgi:hypothetical protein